MLSNSSPTSLKNLRKLEPTIKKPEISPKKSKSSVDRPESNYILHEPISIPREPTDAKSNSRLRSPRSKSKRSYDKYLIDLNNYEVTSQPKGGVIGFTNFIRNKKTDRQYSAKTSLFENAQDRKLLLRDITLLIHINHSTIASVQGFSYEDFQGSNKVTVIHNYYEKGSLFDLIEKVDQTELNNTKRQIILSGIARGMMILHKRHTIHQDLKLDNILLDKNYHPKLTDFGLSKIFNTDKNLMTNLNSIAYIAPEVFKNDSFTSKSDVYAFGILMYELIGNTRAYKQLFESNEFNISSFQEKVMNGLRPEFTFPIKRSLQKMIETCWSENPNDRPTFSELFCKLSLLDEETFMDFEANDYEAIIKDESGSNDRLNYCLEDVNTDEFYLYVDEILENSTIDNKQEEIEHLKAKNLDMVQLSIDQKSQISYLTKYISLLKEDNSKLRENIMQLINENSNLTKENLQLKKDAAHLIRAPPSNNSNNNNSSNISDAEEIEMSEFQKLCDSITKEVRSGNMTVVELPRSFTTIPDSMFKFCIKLKEIKIPSSVKSIGSDAFYECTSLSKIEIPNSVTRIGDHAFCLCSLLVDVVIPPSVVYIGSHAFSRCLSLKRIELPSSVKVIGSSAFSWCTSLSSVKVPSSIEKIEDCTFFGCSSLTNVLIPSSVKSIGYDAFYKCTSLRKIELPSSVTSIEKGAFHGCLSLHDVVISSSLALISDYTFFECSALEDVTIPASVERIGSRAFGQCSSLTSVKIPSSVKSYESNSFPPETEIIQQ